MNDTNTQPEADVQNTVEIVLLIWTILEQLLSFSPESYPKSVSQLLIFICYRAYKLLPKKKKVGDVESQTETSSIVSTRSWKTLISVNVGP
jgi:hypothetical protein